MRLVIVTLVFAVLAGCATTNSNRTIAPTCEPVIGMAESKFVECACIRPLLNPDGGIKQISKIQTAQSISTIYACARYGKSINASFRNGLLDMISDR